MNKDPKKISTMAASSSKAIGLGAGVGMILGSAFGSPGHGLVFGAGFGLVFATVLERAGKR